MPYLSAAGTRFHYHIDDYSQPWRHNSAVMLHHAAGGNLARWRVWVPLLAQHHPVVRFDMRGHSGTSPPPNGLFDLPDLAADISAVLDSLGIGKVHLVGASAGGIVSIRFAHDYPERLHSLSLVASTPRLAQLGANVDATAWRRTLEESGTRAWLLADSERRFGPDVDPRVVEWYADEGEKTPAEVVLALQSCLLSEDLTELLPNIHVPTLILASSNDEITPLEVQHLMAAQIPNARLETFDGVGHNMKVEIPELLSERVSRFIDRIDGETGPSLRAW